MSLARARQILLGFLGMLGPAASLAGQSDTPPRADVAVLPFEFAPSNDSMMAGLAGRCASQLVDQLRAAKIAAVHAEGAKLERMRADRTALLAVQGTLTRPDGKYAAELQLLDVQSGDELRSYFYGPGDEAGVVGMVEAAVPRIAAVVGEARSQAR